MFSAKENRVVTLISRPILSTQTFSYMQIVTVDRDNRHYQFDRQSLEMVSSIVTGNACKRILGRQPFCTVPARSTAQIGKLVLLPIINAQFELDLTNSFC